MIGNHSQVTQNNFATFLSVLRSLIQEVSLEGNGVSLFYIEGSLIRAYYCGFEHGSEKLRHNKKEEKIELRWVTNLAFGMESSVLLTPDIMILSPNGGDSWVQ